MIGKRKSLGKTQDLMEIVDADDRVIGWATRGEVDAQRLPVRAARVIVYDKMMNIGVQKRAEGKPVYGGAYDVGVAEGVLLGESYAQAGVRGVLEEMFDVHLTAGKPFQPRLMNLEPVARLPTFTDVNLRRTYWVYAFCYDHLLHGPMAHERSEVESFLFLSVPELRKYLNDPGKEFIPVARVIGQLAISLLEGRLGK